MTQPTRSPFFFLHFFHSLLFQKFIFFFCVRVGLCLSLSRTFFIGTKFVLRAVETTTTTTTTTTTEEERCSTTLGRRCVSLSLFFFSLCVTAGFIFISRASSSSSPSSSLNRHTMVQKRNGVTNCSSSSRINNRRENRPRTWKSFHPDRSSC